MATICVHQRLIAGKERGCLTLGNLTAVRKLFIMQIVQGSQNIRHIKVCYLNKISIL